MKPQKRFLREQKKRFFASFNDFLNPSPRKRKVQPTKCIHCKKDITDDKNFIFVYKKNHELKGKSCPSCYADKISKSK